MGRIVHSFSRDLRLHGAPQGLPWRAPGGLVLEGFATVRGSPGAPLESSWRPGSRGICDCPGGLLEGFATVRVSPRPPGELLEAWFSRDLRLHGAPGRSPGEPPGELLEAWFSRDLRLSGAPGRPPGEPPGELLEAWFSRDLRLYGGWSLPGISRKLPGKKRLSVKTWKMLIRVGES